MFFDGSGFFDFVGGAGEGGSFFSGFFDSLLGGGDILGGAARMGASEGLLSDLLGGFFRLAGGGADLYFDYICYRDLFGKGKNQSYGNFKQAFDGMPEADRLALRKISEVAKGHGFILQQLRAHQHEAGVQEILTEYEKLGNQLPDAELLKKAFRKLSPHLHPDKNKYGEGLFKDLNNANQTLGNAEKCAAYNEMLKTNPEGLGKIMENLGKVDWEKAYEAAERIQRKQIAFDKATEAKGASKWLNELGTNKLALLIAAATIATAAGIYAAAAMAEKRKSKPHNTKHDTHSSFRQKLENESLNHPSPISHT